ncbi:hypothetical protein CK203_048855 [Vitis vinifera]|uniref:Transposase-associated domain-containing protein n=1 Tax=Vitis vinifera TaxID=29760 RepID=A0A438FKW3_VITVI|nr:hypothetical protein CK203_048855 [Vitis vinifera]
MDRSWMSKDRMSWEYEEGVEYFINFALEHCPNQSGIRCPCMRCGNLIHHTPNKIRGHMFFNSIDQSYHTWYWHGEIGPTSRQPTEMAQCYDTMDCGDVASPVEMVHVIEDEFMTDPISFKNLLEDAEKPLYLSCINFTKLSALVKLYNVKARWKVNKVGARNTKRIPTKVLWYFPPIPRFKRMFQSPKIVKDLKWHAQGPRQPGKNIDVYLAPLVNDLKALWEVGVKAYDAHQREFFTLKTILLWMINDLPAYGNLSGCTVKEYHACPIYGEEINSHWLKHGNKNSYTGHRREKNVCESIIGIVIPVCAKVVDVSRLNDLQQDIVVTLCLLEKYFPPSIYDIMLHLTVHLVREVRLSGLVYMRWMYPFERYMKVLKGYVQNHNHPKRCIAECYIAEEALEFCIEYLSGMDVSDDISKKELIEKELKWLTQGPRQQVLTYPGYIINGYCYHIKDHDEAQVNQNSGVSIVASTMQIASSKDKNPMLGDMCFYGIVREIWDLDYNMFNIFVFKCDWYMFMSFINLSNINIY